MRRFLIATFLMCFIFTETFAAVNIVSLLPNPTGDDTLSEYIEIRNTGCESIDIGGYTLSDASTKTFTIPGGTTLASHENRRFFYSETKIALNNSGNETVYLKDVLGVLIDSYSYAGTQRDDVILSISYTDASCDAPIVSDTGATLSTGATDAPIDMSSGTLDTGSGDILSDTGVTLPTASGGEMISSGTIDTSSGALSDTGTTLVDATGSRDTESMISTDSGSISPPLPYIETGALAPISLAYDDVDADSRIDTLIIEYPYILTGVVHTGSIALFSQTGGLYYHRIDTQTGYILDATLSGHLLILTLLEGDIEKTVLKINNTTSSDLRLKTLSDMGFRSLGGQVPVGFLLTSSFDSYRAVTSRVLTVSTASGSTSTSGTPLVPIAFPDIIPILQSPTNATFSGGVFTCTSLECRINITLEPIFSSGYSMRDYYCAFGTGEILSLDTDCNPTTAYYTSSGAYTIELTSRVSPLTSIRMAYPVIFDMQNSSVIPSVLLSTPDTVKPVAVLELDGKWKDYYEQIDTYEMMCYTWTCSLNFTAEHSYDPGGGKVRFFWIYGTNRVGWSEDPGTQKYTAGTHEMILRVIDMAGNYDEVRYIVHVVGPRPKVEKPPTEKKQKSSKSFDTVKAEKKKKPKRLKMVFFSPPNIELQGRTGTGGDGVYTCQYKRTPHCSLNFTLDETLRGYTYSWILDGELVHTGKNPKSWKLSPGEHSLELRTYMSGALEPLDTQTYSLVVERAPRVAKAPKPKKPKPQSSPKQEVIPTAYADTSDTSTETTHTAGVVIMLFAAGIGMGYVLRRRKYR